MRIRMSFAVPVLHHAAHPHAAHVPDSGGFARQVQGEIVSQDHATNFALCAPLAGGLGDTPGCLPPHDEAAWRRLWDTWFRPAQPADTVVYEALGMDGAILATVARRAGLTPRDTLHALTRLQARHLVHRDHVGRWVRTTRASRREVTS